MSGAHRPRLVTHRVLRDAILDCRDDWVASGSHDDFERINSGYCEEFAAEVLTYLRSSFKGGSRDVHEFGLEDVQMPDETESDRGAPLDQALLARAWPDVEPTHDLTWDEVDDLFKAAGFCAGTHVWIHFDGLHYDAERPEGVRNFLELPFFDRVVVAWIEEGMPDHIDVWKERSLAFVVKSF